jgi:hypothetical protein
MNLEHASADQQALALQAPVGKAIFVELESLMPPMGEQHALELQFMLAPATATALRALHGLGATVFVVSYAQPADLDLQLLQHQGVARQLSALGDAVCAGCYSWQDLPGTAPAEIQPAGHHAVPPAAPCPLLRHICARHGLDASRCWFIGASAPGVARAAHSGLHTIFLRSRDAAPTAGGAGSPRRPALKGARPGKIFRAQPGRSGIAHRLRAARQHRRFARVVSQRRPRAARAAAGAARHPLHRAATRRAPCPSY